MPTRATIIPMRFLAALLSTTLTLPLFAQSPPSIPPSADPILTACRTKPSPPQPAEAVSAVAAIRRQIDLAQLDDASTAAHALIQQFPANAAAQAALAELDYRRGDFDHSISSINLALKLDPCDLRIHYDAFRLLDLSGKHLTAHRQLQLAHDLNTLGASPPNQHVERAWNQDQAAAASTDCRLINSPASATLHLDPRGESQTRLVHGANLSVSLNGKSTTLVLDTGDPGITLSEAQAKRSGIVPGKSITSAAHSATGNGSVTAYDSIAKTVSIGPLTFENCRVNVVLDPPITMGGIGPRIFHDFLITLDPTHARINLDPLPAPPPSSTPPTPFQDRYVDPSMQTWLRFDTPPDLNRIILPTRMNNAGPYLLILDTGAPRSHLDTDAAREVTKVNQDLNTRVSGYGGVENDVYSAEHVQLQFGPVSRTFNSMLTYSRTQKSQAAGVRIAGDIGWDAISDLLTQIDYRDQLINFESPDQPTTDRHKH